MEGKKTVFYNGKVAIPRGFASGLAVDGQTILSVGSSEEVLADCGAAEKIDLDGRLVLPGFNDGHMHFLAYALSLEQGDFTGSSSLAEVRSRFRSFLDRTKPKEGEWIVGRGWNHELFEEQRIFTKEDLDDLSLHNPVLLTRVCGHVAVLNSVGLALLGLTAESRFPGGVVDLGEEGRPTGVIRETVVEWARSQIPLPDSDTLRRLVARGGEEAAKVGLTSIQSDDLGSVGGDFRKILDLYLSLDREGKMPLRITEQFLLRTHEALDDFLAEGWRTGDGSPFFHVGPLKILTDGSMGGRTALLREDYSDMPEVKGVAIYTQDELDRLVLTASNAGMQVAAHAIGDGALDMCLDAMEKALNAAPRAARHFIVHCQMGELAQYQRMARLGVGAAVQPPFVPSDRPMALKRIGEKRAHSGYAWKTLLDLGIFLSGGSDCPVEIFNPLWGIASAVTRQDEKGNPAGGWNPSQKLRVGEAVDLYTRGGAYASFEEDRKGTLEAGKYSDLVVLSQNIFSIPEEEIQFVEAELTMAGGKVTHRTF